MVDTARRRRGAVLVKLVLVLAILLGFASLAVDVGNVYSIHAQLQATAEASALAAAEGLTISPEEARARAIDYAGKNTANGAPVALASGDVEVGLWNPVSRIFTPLPGSAADAVKPDAVRVVTRLEEARGNAVNLSLAGLFGVNRADVSASAIAYYRARDIMLVLDCSGSMNDDSELRHVDTIGQQAIETNLYQIWTELGAPVYGSMQFAPVYIGTSDDAQILAALGLDGVPYPHPGGSWFDYFDYVRDDGAVNDAGYRRRYGGLTLVNYWLSQQPGADETPGLWQASAQPITAVKDAVELFLDYLEQVNTGDRVGVSVYTADDGTALLEIGLTDSFTQVEAITRQRQAGHYDPLTNIGAGISVAREELVGNGRPGTFKMIVLLTDGVANRPGNGFVARQYARQQAALTADAGIPILTISLGANADTSLMTEIAETTGGVHFNVPGGQSVSAYEDDLNEVFADIAEHRPLKLVD